jgi:hypothetical protein
MKSGTQTGLDIEKKRHLVLNHAVVAGCIR